MRISSMDIDAVSFDVDGTLYSQKAAVFRLLPELYAERRLLKAYELERERMRGKPGLGDLRRVAAGRAARTCGMSEDEACGTVERLVFRRWNEVLRPSDVFPGVRKLLVRLLAGGVKIAAISDYPVEGKLRSLGLDSFTWATCMSCEDVGSLKPAPDVFTAAASRLGVVPSRVLHIGDREDCDVAGAHAAGMKSAFYARGIRKIRYLVRGSRAEIVFSDYTKFPV